MHQWVTRSHQGQANKEKKKRKRTKGQTMTYTTLHRNRMIEQYDPTENHV